MLINPENMHNRYDHPHFRYQNMWSSHEKFFNFMHEVWKELVFKFDLIKLVAKLKKSEGHVETMK